MRLTPEQILHEYARGRFPMADPFDGTVAWHAPARRGFIPLEGFHVPRRLRRYLKKFRYATDHDFRGVVEGCARPVTWISGEIANAFGELHRQGHAHSIEAYAGERLAGGLYGVQVGGAFMAESMFYAVPNASSACLVKLVERLRARGFALLDVQQVLPHTARFGAVEVSRAEYLRLLDGAARLSPRWKGEDEK